MDKRICLQKMRKHQLEIKKLDLVHDTTVVDVCFKIPQVAPSGDIPAGHPESAEMVQVER